MKKRSKLTLHRETLARLEPKLLRRAVGGDYTCSCCYSACCPPETYDCPTLSCGSCPCGGDSADPSCPCI